MKTIKQEEIVSQFTKVIEKKNTNEFHSLPASVPPDYLQDKNLKCKTPSGTKDPKHRAICISKQQQRLIDIVFSRLTTKQNHTQLK